MKKEIAIAAIAVVTASSALSVINPSMVPKMDENKDGTISKAEFLGFYSASFDRKDKNKDGMLTPDEHTHAGSFKSGDKDKDGKLTREEFITVFKKQFDNTHDKNKDGVVTADEM